MPGEPFVGTWPIPDTEVVEVAHLPETLPDPVEATPYWQVRHGELLIHAHGIASFRISGGQRIEVRLTDPAAADRARFLLTATPFGAQIHQRGELPLHAAGLVPRDSDECILICGDSGSGKSTTAAALVGRGWRVINDDICRFTANGAPRVWPGFQTLKLWPDACSRLGLDERELPPALGFKEKRLLDTPGFPNAANPKGVLVLDRSPAHGVLNSVRLTGLDAVLELTRQSFRPQLLKPMGCLESHFRIANSLLRHVPLHKLCIPIDMTPDQIAGEIEQFAGKL